MAERVAANYSGRKWSKDKRAGQRKRASVAVDVLALVDMDCD